MDKQERLYVHECERDTADPADVGERWLVLSPYEDDPSDAVVFSAQYYDGIPEEVTQLFEMMAATVPSKEKRPTVVCLCGSTRFSRAFKDANLKETLDGKIVLTIGCDMRSDHDIFGDLSPTEFANVKAQLDELHLRKIDMADEVLILNVNGYIGESTRRELNYATSLGKRIRFLE